MKIAFSTLGCPDWTLAEIIDRAIEYGYDGVELRGLREEIYLPRAADFVGGHRHESRRRFEDAGLDIVCLGSTAFLSRFEAKARQAALDEVRDYVDLAADLGAPFVRVFAGRVQEDGQQTGSEEALIENLRTAGEIAGAARVKIVLETHDDFIRSEPLARVMRAVDQAQVGILWDIHHPVRFENEPVAHTWETIGRWVWHTHVKDSRRHGEGYVYTPLGEGDIPLKEAIRLLHESGYAGSLSLEWEKRWHPEIADPEVVFPQYARGLRELIEEVEAG